MFLISLTCLLLCGSIAVQGILIPVPRGTCKLPFDTGSCRGNFNVWTYSAASGGCIQAVYGGCGGNANRFESKELCEIQCLPENICNLNFYAGLCKANIPVYTHSSTTGQCVIAIYGGCNGNSNTFSTKEECQEFCQVVPSILDCHTWQEGSKTTIKAALSFRPGNDGLLITACCQITSPRQQDSQPDTAFMSYYNRGP